MGKEYANYHKHDHVSSIMTPDTHIKAEEYILRAKELGHSAYFTTNHGTGGDIFEAKTLCDKYGLRCIYGIEGYIVPDPLEKDNRNYHIIIVPRTNQARKKLNLVTSRASEEGFYYKPRIFIEDLLNLEPEDYYLTTACVAGLLKDEDSFENLFSPLANHFGKNMLLEVQSHDNDTQREINKKCLALRKAGYRLVAANDSHYIYPEQSAERDEYLKGKGISYPDEEKFILDYPDYDTMIQRFKKQGVLSEEQIIEAIDNTMLFLDCEDIYLDKEIKMPTIYPDLTTEEKITELKKHINKAFTKVKESDSIPKERIPEYIKEIKYEMDIIEKTAEVRSVDYFLLNEKIVDLAVNKYGGVLTRTGRGSCGSFYTNRILGMTQLDRLNAPVVMYPDRFMSTARLLENRALPDIDFNIVDQEPFAAASRELLGQHSCYPMVAYGSMQLSEAFRNICRSAQIPYDEYNEVAKDLENYAEDKKWKSYIDKAKRFVGSIVSASPHPCAFVLDNKDLREEYGVVRIGEALCVMVTSVEADEYKLLKDDFLIVSCWELISDTFKMIGIPIMTIQEIEQQSDDKVWSMYELGMTATLNQVDGEWATGLIMDYKPKNLRELSMFVACLRPFFNSNRAEFIARKVHSTGSKHLDEILKDTNGYILFQESLMKYFEWLGVSPAESIGLIKKISKKKIHQEDFDNLTERLRKQWIINTGSEDMFDETFADIQSCMSYGFAAPHALAVAIDSLYSAYLKVNYPMEYYTVCLNLYGSNQDKTRRLTKELDYFGIKVVAPKFRYSGADYVPDRETKRIYKGISSIKYINRKVSDALYEMRNMRFDSFVDFLKVNPCDARQTEVLIKLDFFSEFGKRRKLLEEYNIFKEYYGSKQMSKGAVSPDLYDILTECATQTPKLFKNIDSEKLVKKLCFQIPDEDITVTEIIEAQIDYLGYIEYVDPSMKKTVVILSENLKHAPRLTIYSLAKGIVSEVRMGTQLYKSKKLKVGSIFVVKKDKVKPKVKCVNDEFIPIPNTKEFWIEDLGVINC